VPIHPMADCKKSGGRKERHVCDKSVKDEPENTADQLKEGLDLGGKRKKMSQQTSMGGERRKKLAFPSYVSRHPEHRKRLSLR